VANQTHSAITDPDIHEPKGVSTAAKGRSYQADGSGSGVWTRPLTLITSASTASVSSFDVTGLSGYRELIVVIEQARTQAKDLKLRLYSTSAAAWRTSGYLNGYLSTSADLDESGTLVSGMYLGSGNNDNRDYLTSVTRLTNFNNSSEKTIGLTYAVSTQYPMTTNGTISSNTKGQSTTSIYNTAEAHEGIRILTDGTVISNLYYTIWGIKT